MHLSIKDNKQQLWYILLIVCFTFILLYVNFPSKALTNYIRVEAEKRFPAIDIGFDKIGLTLSPGIKIRGLKISLREDPDTPVYVSEKSSVRVSIWSWLKGEPRYYFTSTVIGGKISGFFEEKDEVKEERIDAAIDIEGLTLDDRIFIHPIVNGRLEGVLTGKITFMGNLSDPLKGNTEISLNLSDGKIKFKAPVLNLDELEYKKINVSGVIDNRRLNIKDLNMTGGPVNCTATGTIQISNDFLNSRLNIKTEIEPLPSFYQEMPAAKNVINLVKNKMKDGKLLIDFQGTLNRVIPKFR